MGISLAQPPVLVTLALSCLPNKHKDGGDTGRDATQMFPALDGG